MMFQALLAVSGVLKMCDGRLDDGKHQGLVFARVIRDVDYGAAYVYGFTVRIRRGLLVSDC